MRVFLVDADYIVEDGKPLVRLFGVDANGASVCVLDTYEPYLYAAPTHVTKELQDRISKQDGVTRVDVVKKNLNGQETDVIRVYAATPSDIPNVRDALKRFREIGHEGCYEYTINFYKRYLIDRGVAPGAWYDVDGNDVKKNYEWDFKVIVKAKSIRPASGEKPKLRTLAFDIESYEEGGKTRIIMLSLYGERYKRVYTYKKAKYASYVDTVKDEKELLQAFVNAVRAYDPDVLVTYNGDEFDFALLGERCDELGIRLTLGRDGKEVTHVRRMRVSSARLAGRVHMDLYQLVNNILKFHLDTETLTLDAVASEVLGDRKIEVTYEQMLEAWRSGQTARLAEYNLKDSELTYRLALHFMPLVNVLARIVGQPPFDVSRMSYSQLVEWYLTRQAHAMGYITPNQPKFEEIEHRRGRTYAGGYVKEPIGGIHEGIAVMDFRSLYPSIIASHNISPETLDCADCEGVRVPGTKHHFCKKRKGFYSTVVRGLIEERLRIKGQIRKAGHEQEDLKLEEQALKMVTNASYGALAYVGAKWYSYECAESAAAYGRYYIELTITEAEKSGFTVIYADTDSCFVKSGGKIKNVEKAAAEFKDNMNKKLPGISEPADVRNISNRGSKIMELELQGTYTRGIFIPKGSGHGTAKKRYALIDSKGNLTIRGLETVRRDWCALAKNVQREVLMYILKKKDKEGAIGYMKSVVEKVQKKNIPIRDLVIHEQLTKRLEEYRQIGPHVVAARKIKERGRPYGPGMVVAYVIAEGNGSISQRAEPLEDASVERIDSDYYINNQIVPAGMRVLQVLDVTEDELKGLGSQQTIRKFVKKG
ncbi:MAG: ribonuclease H-like domain-containing protein [Candidatus Aenigmarchaeota archaeon]|nr:ribonuclease H-like domain-containing protein [Candidatus Aenigmarchaeota archaeon]